jgi:hypothetical protein
MRSGFWTFVLLLMGALVCVSAIPQPDLPETSYNEVDTPVNQSPPVVPGIRLVRPVVTPSILPRQILQAWSRLDVQSHDRSSADSLLRPDPHSLQELLCTLLI